MEVKCSDGGGVVAVQIWKGIPASTVQRLARSLHSRRDHRLLWLGNYLNTQVRVPTILILHLMHYEHDVMLEGAFKIVKNPLEKIALERLGWNGVLTNMLPSSTTFRTTSRVALCRDGSASTCPSTSYTHGLTGEYTIMIVLHETYFTTLFSVKSRVYIYS